MAPFPPKFSIGGGKCSRAARTPEIGCCCSKIHQRASPAGGVAPSAKNVVSPIPLPDMFGQELSSTASFFTPDITRYCLKDEVILGRKGGQEHCRSFLLRICATFAATVLWAVNARTHFGTQEISSCSQESQFWRAQKFSACRRSLSWPYMKG